MHQYKGHLDTFFLTDRNNAITLPDTHGWSICFGRTRGRPLELRKSCREVHAMEPFRVWAVLRRTRRHERR